MLEVLLLTPPALLYALWLAATGRGHFLQTTSFDTTMLLGCGLITAVPLTLMLRPARSSACASLERMPMSTCG